MPEIFKLNNLPEKQRCRKILRILESAENAIVCNISNEFLDLFYLKTILELVLSDVDENAYNEITAWLKNPDENTKRYIINFTRYELYKKLGVSPSEWDLILPDEDIKDLNNFKRRFFKNVYLYAEDIRTPFNIGSIFRTAESFGVEKIFLSENCVSPENKKAERTAMGCTKYLPWERRRLDDLPNVPIMALETGGSDIRNFRFPDSGIVIIGSEELGVSPEGLKKASAGIVTIPMYGIKASINVSVAVGIFMQKWIESITANKNADFYS